MLYVFPFPSTRIGVADKRAIEKWIELTVQRMVEQPISHYGLMDVTRLWIVYLEGFIHSVPIGVVFQIAVQDKYVVH